MATPTINAPNPACTTINEVIEALEAIVQQSIKTNSKAGYFAVLYYCVTCRVREGIQKNEFEDGARMEQLDVIFANRYLEAWHLWQGGRKTTEAWAVAFRSALVSRPIVLQHLLLGINAHINLDLSIAAVETMKDGNLQHIRNDFNSINAILGAMIDHVQDNISKVSPLMKLLDLYGRNHDEKLVEFSINAAREGAWRFALELNQKSGAAYAPCIATRDAAIARIGNNIATPNSRLLNWTLKAIRASEWRAASEIIQLLRII